LATSRTNDRGDSGGAQAQRKGAALI
jgi:hypothetical protein